MLLAGRDFGASVALEVSVSYPLVCFIPPCVALGRAKLPRWLTLAGFSFFAGWCKFGVLAAALKAEARRKTRYARR
jgi:hypothetical protein